MAIVPMMCQSTLNLASATKPTNREDMVLKTLFAQEMSNGHMTRIGTAAASCSVVSFVPMPEKDGLREIIPNHLSYEYHHGPTKPREKNAWEKPFEKKKDPPPQKQQKSAYRPKTSLPDILLPYVYAILIALAALAALLAWV